MISRHLTLEMIAAGLLMGLALPAPAFAQEAAEEESASVSKSDSEESADKKEEEEEKAWSVGASVNTSIGQGTFVDPANDTQWADVVGPGSNAFDRVMMSFSLSGSYTFLDDYSASVGIAATQGITAGGGANYPSEYRFQDTSVGLGWAGHSFGDTGLHLSADAGFVFPTSDFSQITTLIVGTSLGASLSWTIFDGDLRLSYGLSGGKDFHEYTSPVVEEDESADFDTVIWRAGGSEELGQGLYAIDGVNTEWSVSNSFNASFKIVEKLRGSVSYAISTFWTYDVFEPDELTSEFADPSRGTGQVARTSLSLSYPLTPVAELLHLSSMGLSAGVSTGVQPKTDDNKSFRFPFWNIDGAARNMSQIRFGLSASY